MKCETWAMTAVLICGISASCAEPELPPLQKAAPAPVPEVPKASAPAAVELYQTIWEPPQTWSAWGNRIWWTNEYLLWWEKNAPLPVPLITTSSAADLGTLGAPTTRVLYGGENQQFGAFSGYRTNFGRWFGQARTVGVESTLFFMEHLSTVGAVHSNAAGSPTFAVPIFDPRTSGSLLFPDQPAGATLPGEAGLAVTRAGAFRGGIVAKTATQMWGADVNLLYNLVRNDTWMLNAVGGFRYLDLFDNVSVQTDAVGLPGSGTFKGARLETRDRFRTENEFCGGQLGVQAGAQYGRCTLHLNALVALGDTNQQLGIKGATLIKTSKSTVLPDGSYAGGLLAVPSNMGHQSADAFAVVPELKLQFAYSVCRTVRLTCGYTFLYWSNVARAGDTIDRVVNPMQTPIYSGLAPVSSSRPAPLFQQTDFWAQGINLGFSVQF